MEDFVKQEDIEEKIIGRKYDEVKAEGNSWTLRKVAEDGEMFMVTMDFNPNRVNVKVEGGIITEITGIN